LKEIVGKKGKWMMDGFYGVDGKIDYLYLFDGKSLEKCE
jgi:hypothetical protein